MFPSADVFIAGKASCLQTGSYQIATPESDFLSIADRKLALTDDTEKASQWRITELDGYCSLENEADKSSLELETGQAASWLIIGASDGQVQLFETKSEQYLNDDLSFSAEANETSYWRLEPLK